MLKLACLNETPHLALREINPSSKFLWGFETLVKHAANTWPIRPSQQQSGPVIQGIYVSPIFPRAGVISETSLRLNTALTSGASLRLYWR